MRAFIIALVLSGAPDDPLSSDTRKLACQQVREQIRKVESQMRAGYTRAQGERLQARLRKLRKKRFRVCR